ncbi:uncharacterized protein PV07_08784 [Cladophialophora immunda]|uniref:Uncharacterized protein n=1 Tax=Cladophialophora immunda TaxID=569365 RepID=A0A0D2C337_9EURO|nr:uncharacterized protein PV07_08784 [Cladophialophora immunda]KIW25618.1 hypothetical protein PV07_08784 [Cladophialophora immunda]OQV10786.1 hypothetical protein CLAIMM_14728 [Cladophialophora immunda]
MSTILTIQPGNEDAYAFHDNTKKVSKAESMGWLKKYKAELKLTGVRLSRGAQPVCRGTSCVPIESLEILENDLEYAQVQVKYWAHHDELVGVVEIKRQVDLDIFFTR